MRPTGRREVHRHRPRRGWVLRDERRWRRRRGALAIAVAVLAAAAACTGPDDAQRIRALVAQGASSAEKHRVDEVLALATDDLRAEPGDRDRAETRDALAMAVQHYGRFKILYPEPAVEVAEEGGSARAAFPFLVARFGASHPELEDLRGDAGAWLTAVGRNSPDLYLLTLRLVKAEGEWKVRVAELTSLGERSF